MTLGTHRPAADTRRGGAMATKGERTRDYNLGEASRLIRCKEVGATGVSDILAAALTNIGEPEELPSSGGQSTRWSHETIQRRETCLTFTPILDQLVRYDSPVGRASRIGLGQGWGDAQKGEIPASSWLKSGNRPE